MNSGLKTFLLVNDLAQRYDNDWTLAKKLLDKVGYCMGVDNSSSTPIPNVISLMQSGGFVPKFYSSQPGDLLIQMEQLLIYTVYELNYF